MTVFEVMELLSREGVFFTLSSHRDGSVMVAVSIPGERWEIECFANGNIELEVFKSNGEISDENGLLLAMKSLKEFESAR